MKIARLSLWRVSLFACLALLLWPFPGNWPLLTVHYSPSTVLLAQQPQAFVKQAGSGLVASVATFPNLNIAAGSVLCSKATVSYAGGQVSTLQNGINYVYFNCGSRAPQSNTTGFRGGESPLAIVVARGGSYGPSELLDVREWAVTGPGTNGLHIRNNPAGTRGPIVFETAGGAEKMRVDTGGNVGIGTTNRLSGLTLKGPSSFSATGTVSISNGSTSVTGTSTIFTLQVGIGDRVTISTQTRTVTGIASDTSLTVDTAFTTTASGQTMTVLKSLFRTDDSSGNTQVVISDQGNVGIGTTTPGYPLDVNGQPRYTGSRVFYTTAGESGQTFLEEFGTPRGAGTKSWVLRLSEGPNSGTYWDAIKLSRTSDNSGNVLLAQYAGNVGIGLGATTPALQLQVNKAIGAGVKTQTTHGNITFDASIGNTFRITLDGTGSITASLQNCQNGQWLVFDIVGDGTHSWSWSSSWFRGGGSVDTVSTHHSRQMFVCDSSGVAWSSSPIQTVQ